MAPKPGCDTYYSTCGTLDVNCYVYWDAALSDPASSTYLSDGTYCYTTNGSGMITSKTVCTTSYDVTFYTKAGATITSGEEYTLYYSSDGVNYTYLAGPLSSTSCTLLSTQTITSSTVYVKATRDSNAAEIRFAAANSSACPSNGGTLCVYSLSLTGNTNVAITVNIISGDFDDC
jgi:hypothetical protein